MSRGVSKDRAKEIAMALDYVDRPWSEMRDAVDHETYGQFDAFQLDLLTDWVKEEMPQQDYQHNQSLNRLSGDLENE
jgi:hypothetical protein